MKFIILGTFSFSISSEPSFVAFLASWAAIQLSSSRVSCNGTYCTRDGRAGVRCWSHEENSKVGIDGNDKFQGAFHVQKGT